MSEGSGNFSVPVELMFLGAIVIAAHAFQLIFKRYRIPDNLWLIGIGLLIGPLFGWVQPEDFGILGEILTAIALAVILFEAGLEIDLAEVRPTLKGSLGLVATAYTLTAVLVAVITHFVIGIPWESAFFAGAVLAAPSPPIIIPLLNGLGFRPELRTTITVESAIGEAAGLVIALGLLEATKLDDVGFGRIAGGVLQAFVMAAVVGVLGGLVWAHGLSWVRSLKNSMILTPAFIFIVFGLSEYLGFSGPIAALAFGMTMANLGALPRNLRTIRIGEGLSSVNGHNADETRFVAEVVFLLKTFFFVFLGLSMRPADLFSLPAVLFVAVLVFARLVSVRLCLMSSLRSSREGLLTSLMVPRGLAAAVLAAAAAETPTLIGGELVDNLIYSVILYSIVFTAVGIIYLERFPVTAKWSRVIFPTGRGNL